MSSDPVATNECFDIEKLAAFYDNALVEDDDVRIDDYLESYEEVMKFFLLMGSVFKFVSSDVRTKMNILYEFRKHDQVEEQKHFDTIKTMLLYEKGAGLLVQKGYVSGSRTLLRLHRGLEFVYEFLYRLKDVADDDKAHTICRSAYDDTLAKHHPFLIRKGAQVAMLAIPTRGELLNRICRKDDIQRSIEILPIMLEHMRIVYDRIDQLYTQQDLHNLP
ncbi:ceramide-1-phosphate transfer protein [Drosophila busckii]|uniref:ceramide-1-phosphate transfer protein n=1 Tax=Drosophila busckii TaxID=30019 RepID=UPI00083F424D|nr:ceramide-1-phosphate transfer protein [Drosophila busckii]